MERIAIYWLTLAERTYSSNRFAARTYFLITFSDSRAQPRDQACRVFLEV